MNRHLWLALWRGIGQPDFQRCKSNAKPRERSSLVQCNASPSHLLCSHPLLHPFAPSPSVWNQVPDGLHSSDTIDQHFTT